ncbi:unnamed protein product [Lampetra fluviatilis]
MPALAVPSWLVPPLLRCHLRHRSERSGNRKCSVGLRLRDVVPVVPYVRVEARQGDTECAWGGDVHPPTGDDSYVVANKALARSPHSNCGGRWVATAGLPLEADPRSVRPTFPGKRQQL